MVTAAGIFCHIFQLTFIYDMAGGKKQAPAIGGRSSMGTDQESYCGNRMDSYEERRNKVRRFQLTSDIFFCKVLEDKEACQEVIRILLGHPS